jgi:hypothetical protein
VQEHRGDERRARTRQPGRAQQDSPVVAREQSGRPSLRHIRHVTSRRHGV